MSIQLEMWYRLMVDFNNAKRFKFPFSEEQIKVRNGIYVLFEEGELIDGLYRVTRVGINREQNNFLSRLGDHFIKEIQRDSVFRKHFGRCLLHKANDTYLKYWNYDFKSVEDKKKYANNVNLAYELKYEKDISKYVQTSCSFVVIEMNDKKMRKELEEALIATFAQCKQNSPSKTWMANHHPKYLYFKETGLWNVQGRKGQIVTDEQYKLIIKYLVK